MKSVLGPIITHHSKESEILSFIESISSCSQRITGSICSMLHLKKAVITVASAGRVHLRAHANLLRLQDSVGEE